MIILDVRLLIKCREEFGLKTIHEVNMFVEKYGIHSEEELERVLNGELSVSAIISVGDCE